MSPSYRAPAHTYPPPTSARPADTRQAGHWSRGHLDERLDGSGYPDGLHGDVLDRPARILAVADVFEALSADRPYRAPLSDAEALAMVQQDAGRRLSVDTTTALGGLLADSA